MAPPVLEEDCYDCPDNLHRLPGRERPPRARRGTRTQGTGGGSLTPRFLHSTAQPLADCRARQNTPRVVLAVNVL